MVCLEMEKDDKRLQLLGKCPVERIEQFTYSLIDSICGLRAPLYCDYSDIWTLSEWWEVIDTWKKFICGVVSLGGDKDKVSARLSELPQSYRQLVENCLSIRSTDIRHALVEKTCAISGSYLNDFDWKLKLVLASDKLSSIKEPRLELDMELQNGCDKEELSVEMSKEELKYFIDSLEAVHKEIVPMMT